MVGECQPRLLAGDPKEFIPLFRYVLLVYSQPLKETLFEGAERPEDWEACRFADAIFRVCRDKLNLHPSLNLKQFLSQGFSERKLILLVDLISLCRSRNVDLQRQIRVGSKRITPADGPHLCELSQPRRLAPCVNGLRIPSSEQKRHVDRPQEDSTRVQMEKQLADLARTLEKLSMDIVSMDQHVDAIRLSHTEEIQTLHTRLDDLESRMERTETTDAPASSVPAPCHVAPEGPSTDPFGADSHQDVPSAHQIHPIADLHVPRSLGSTQELVQAVRSRCHSARALLERLS